MSRKRIVVGEDGRGRPVSRWEDGEPEARQFGHMEPAFDATAIERRHLTPDELAERSRPAMPVLVVADSQRDRFRVANGADEPITKPGIYAQEEATVPEEPTIRSTNIPEVIPELLEHVAGDDPYETLIAAAEAARLARLAEHDARAALRTAVDVAKSAKAALAAAWRIVAAAEDVEALTVPVVISNGGMARIVTEALLGEARASVELDEHPDGARTVTPSAMKPGGDTKRAQEADQRGREVLAALERHGGDTRKAGLELGMRGNVVGRIASAARARGLQVEASA